MPAGPEHDQQPQPDRTGLRAAWLGSRRAAITAGVAAVGVLAGAGAAVAATSSSSSSTPAPAPSASPSARPPFHALPPKGSPWHMHGGPGAFGPAFAGPGLLGGLFGAVHGTAVVPKPGGGYQTVAFQNGKVTAVSGTSITLHSADGYSRTYQVTSATMVNAQRDGIGSIKAGNQVIVTATVSGSTATAARILDVSLLQQGFHRFFGAPPGAGFKTAVPGS